MGNNGNNYFPNILRISAGDTVVFEPNRFHNTESIEGMIPFKEKKWKSSFGKKFKKNLTNPDFMVINAPHITVKVWLD